MFVGDISCPNYNIMSGETDQAQKENQHCFSYTLNLGFEKNVKIEGELWGGGVKGGEGEGTDRGMGQISSKRFYLNMNEVSCKSHYFVCLIYVNKRKNGQIYILELPTCHFQCPL